MIPFFERLRLPFTRRSRHFITIHCSLPLKVKKVVKANSLWESRISFQHTREQVETAFLLCAPNYNFLFLKRRKAWCAKKRAEAEIHSRHSRLLLARSYSLPLCSRSTTFNGERFLELFSNYLHILALY